MKKLDCFRSAGKLTDALRRIPHSSILGTAVISGLLAGSLLTVGCSNKKSKPVANETQTSASQMALNQPVMPAPVASTSASTPVPKKVAKKRVSTMKYDDQTYGVSFRYPWQYSVKSGNGSASDSKPMDFIQPGGLTAVSVDVPKGFYPDTDLSSAFFRVNVNKGLSEAECNQFALPQATEKDAVQPSQLTLGGLELQEVEDISGDDTKQADTRYYHLFQNGSCYEFALGLSTESTGDDQTVAPVTREKVFRRLETILATVKINPEAIPQVANDSTATPTVQDQPGK